ncbi:MAG: zinc metallopeptidase [Clostridia bacterium]|nr:zinc metallopeptidase [Clostridia bacterium]
MNSDYLYFLIILMFFVSLIVQGAVSSRFKKYSQVPVSSGMSGYSAARRILESAGLDDIKIETTRGTLTDHYDPSSKTLRLSETVAKSASVAAVSVAAHEAGHAIQHAQGYQPLMLRTSSVFMVNFGSKLSWPIFLLGLILGISPLVNVGIALYVLIVLFTLITLPVEFNASSRALKLLTQNGIMAESEKSMARAMLSTAAQTYVVSAVSAILQLLRLIAIAQGGKRRD